MVKVNKNTKMYSNIMYDFLNRNYGDIYTAYKTPSTVKVRSFNDIWYRAKQTQGYNNDLKVCSKSCNFYSTIYSFTVDGITYIVKDTYSNTYICEM